jgi:hypothetical protein
VDRWRLPPPSPALAELMARDAEAEDRPFGGYAGEWATPPSEPPPSPAPVPVGLPPPDWEQEERERRTRVAETFFSEDTESYPAKPRRTEAP